MAELIQVIPASSGSRRAEQMHGWRYWSKAVVKMKLERNGRGWRNRSETGAVFHFNIEQHYIRGKIGIARSPGLHAVSFFDLGRSSGNEAESGRGDLAGWVSLSISSNFMFTGKGR